MEYDFTCSDKWTSCLKNVNINEWIAVKIVVESGIERLRSMFCNINEDIFTIFIVSGDPDKLIKNIKNCKILSKLSFRKNYNTYSFKNPKSGVWGISLTSMDLFVKYSKKWIFELLVENIQKDDKYLIIKELVNSDIPQDIINVITLAYIRVYFHTQ